MLGSAGERRRRSRTAVGNSPVATSRWAEAFSERRVIVDETRAFTMADWFWMLKMIGAFTCELALAFV